MATFPSSTARSRWVVVWLLYWAGMAVLTHIPIPRGAGPGIPYADKIVHFLLYFGLAYLGGRRLAASAGRSSIRTLVIWAVAYGIYGALDELAQPWTGRTASAWDWAADMLGITAGTYVAYRRLAARKGSDPIDEGVPL